jgi:hypothetical protein
MPLNPHSSVPISKRRSRSLTFSSDGGAPKANALARLYRSSLGFGVRSLSLTRASSACVNLPPFFKRPTITANSSSGSMGICACLCRSSSLCPRYSRHVRCASKPPRVPAWQPQIHRGNDVVGPALCIGVTGSATPVHGYIALQRRPATIAPCPRKVHRRTPVAACCRVSESIGRGPYTPRRKGLVLRRRLCKPARFASL